jgi:hypothetical protein
MLNKGCAFPLSIARQSQSCENHFVSGISRKRCAFPLSVARQSSLATLLYQRHLKKNPQNQNQGNTQNQKNRIKIANHAEANSKNQNSICRGKANASIESQGNHPTKSEARQNQKYTMHAIV